ncbi:MAG: ABC transporter permease [Candidatus ainarchaeum sp.]|nr:ABC transporter permease [Candidatus ainarchaeum sp.]MDD5096154.1 ABC transporter permease [Candidatus ainarchaeum sp.]
MRTEDMVSYSLRNLRHQKVRTWLTIVGIVVGVAAVIVLVGLADGLRSSVSDQLSAFGPKTIVVSPVSLEGGIGGGTADLRPTLGKLFERDADKIERVEGVELVTKLITTSVDMKFRDKHITSAIYGVDPDAYTETTSIKISEGRFLQPGDRRVAVIGYGIANDNFGDDKIRVNNLVELGGQKYRVVGVLQKSGSSFGPGDSSVFVSYEDGRELAGDALAEREISGIRIMVDEGFDTEEVADNIEYVLASMHKVPLEDKDFTLITPKFIEDQVNSVLGTLTLFLGAVSGIALVVGGVGISNTMFVSVMERTKEIGVLKSVGAQNWQIERLFLVEAAMIGLVGGVMGVLFGIMVVLLLSVFGINATPSIPTVLISFMIAMSVGMAGGFIPARNAAKIPAVEAMRND